MIKELTTWLAAQFYPEKTIGIDIFACQWNVETPDNAILVSEASGKADALLGDKKEIDIQITVRDPDLHTARDLALSCYDFMKQVWNTNLPQVDSGPEYIIQTSENLSLPSLLMQDEKERYLFVLHTLLRVCEVQ